ncbi:MAG: polysaccharide deacetylase family protein [Gallionellaceae bacterium]
MNGCRNINEFRLHKIQDTLFPCHNWKPTLTIKLSLLVFSCCLIITIFQPSLWPWTLGIIFTNHIALTIAGLIPRSAILGPNITRLPTAATLRGEVAITIDDGPNPEVTPLVLDILDRYQAKATFFCIGRLAELHPELCREIIRRGHAIENHCFSHNWYFSLLSPKNIHKEIFRAQNVLNNITGQTPRFFRAPAGLRNPQLEPVLAHCHLHLCSWSKRGFDTQESNVDQVVIRLTRKLKAGDILLLHDGGGLTSPMGTAIILEVLPRLLDSLNQTHLHSVTLRSAIP